MSRDAQQSHGEVLGAFARELRQFQGLGASFFRAAASRSGMNVTDLQVLDLLQSNGPMTAGQLADRADLTTGAITGMINRLEEIGLVRRERDPDDGRRVIVQLASDSDNLRPITAIFDSMGTAWGDLATRYDATQQTFLLEFLKASNALARQELIQLRATPEGERENFSAPMGEIGSGRLVVSGSSRLKVRAAEGLADLYQAQFAGPIPDVKAQAGVVAIRYPRRLWNLSWGQRKAEVKLNSSIPWQIAIQGGAAEIHAELGGLNLTGLEVKGGMSTILLKLPVPSGVVPIHISGGASAITLRRPEGVAARVHFTGWVSTVIFDDQTFSDLGNNVRLHSTDFSTTAPHYAITVASSASMVSITAGE